MMQLGGFRSLETNMLFWLFLPIILCVAENRTMGSVCTMTMWFVPVVCKSTHMDWVVELVLFPH